MQTPEQEVLSILNGFLASKVLMTIQELGIFDALAASPKTRAQLFESHLKRRPGTLLINAAVALGLIDIDGDVLSLPKKYTGILNDDGEFLTTRYLIGFYRAVYDALTELTPIVRDDPQDRHFHLRDYFRSDVESIDRKMARDYSRYMDSTMQRIASVVTETVGFSADKVVLDVCGGPGTFARTLAEENSSLQTAFLDIPAVVELGTELLDGSPARSRVTAIGGDVFETPFPSGTTTITMCRSAHDWSDAKLKPVFERVFAHLPAGGRFLIIERMVPDEVRADAVALYLRAIYFIIKSASATYRSVSEYRTILTDVGFSKIEELTPKRKAYESFVGLNIVAAYKS